MNDIEEMCREHFNEPVLVGSEVGRLIGYAEDDSESYLIIRYPYVRKPNGARVYGHTDIWHTAVGGYIFLDCLRGRDAFSSKSAGYIDDYTRVDGYLEMNDCGKVDEFKREFNLSMDEENDNQ